MLHLPRTATDQDSFAAGVLRDVVDGNRPFGPPADKYGRGNDDPFLAAPGVAGDNAYIVRPSARPYLVALSVTSYLCYGVDLPRSHELLVHDPPEAEPVSRGGCPVPCKWTVARSRLAPLWYDHSRYVRTLG